MSYWNAINEPHAYRGIEAIRRTGARHSCRFKVVSSIASQIPTRSIGER